MEEALSASHPMEKGSQQIWQNEIRRTSSVYFVSDV